MASVILPSTESHIIRGLDRYDVLAFPSANLVEFGEDYFEIEVDNYGDNPKIRPQRKIHINYDGKIISDKINSGVADEWLEQINNNSTTDSDDYICAETTIPIKGAEKIPKEFALPHVTFNCKKIRSLKIGRCDTDLKLTLKDVKMAPLDYTNLDEFPEIKDVKVTDFTRVKWKNYTLVQISGILYLLSRNNVILKVLYCLQYDMQEGDSQTYFYILNEKHFLVYNDGDVYSVLLFSCIEEGSDVE